jgi:hypothetical protein
MTTTSILTRIPILPVYCAFLLSAGAYAQYTFHGSVQDIHGEKLPGVNVVEKGTVNGTVTDVDGKFTIQSTVPNATFVFSFIGLITQEVSAEAGTSILITMLIDEIALNEPTYCYCLSRYSYLGLASGLHYGRVGLKALNITPYLAGLPIRLVSNIEWRTDMAEARYLDLYLRKYQLFYSGSVSAGIYGELKKFQHSATKISELNIAPEFSFSRVRLTAGYTWQEVIEQDISIAGNGYYLGAYFLLRQQLHIDLKAKYIHSRMQYDLRLLEEVPSIRFSFGAGYEKIGNFEEVSPCTSVSHFLLNMYA